MSQPSGERPHVKPYVFEDVFSKSLHFSIHEIQSRMRTLHPHALDLRYTRTMMAFLLFVPQPTSLVMLGLGGGSLAKFCYRYLPKTRMDAVEINPHVIALRDEFCVPPDDERFRVHEADGAQFMREVKQPCDVLLLDAFDDQGLPGALCSLRFYKDCFKAMQPGGVLVANFPAGSVGLDKCIERIRRSFAQAVMQVRGDEGDNVIVFAFKPVAGQALSPQRVGVMGRPMWMDDEAWAQLMPAFAVVLARRSLWARAQRTRNHRFARTHRYTERWVRTRRPPG